MNGRPANKRIAQALGITEHEVGTYVIQYYPLGTSGAWVLTFAGETPDPLRKKAQLNKKLACTVLIEPSPPSQ